MKKESLLEDLLILSFYWQIQCFDYHIDILKPATTVDNKFLSLTIGSMGIKHHFKHFHLKSKKLLALAKGLTGLEKNPNVYLRFGGGNVDHTEFDPTEYILNATMFTDLCEFVNELDCKLIFGLNLLNRYPDGSWDPSNAVKLIDFAVKSGFDIQFELGNEPDLYPKYQNITIPPRQLAEDFKTLRRILNVKFPYHVMLIGPDVATLDRYNYFERVLSSMEEGVLDAVSFHYYYSSSHDISVINFTSVDFLDLFLNFGLHALSIIGKSFSSFPHPPVWIGETSSTYGGSRVAGSRVAGESYASGFVRLDKLGLAAQMNISVLLRESFVGAFYSLLTKKHYDPNPDYWSSLLYKQLMGRTVLDVTGFLKPNRTVRVYAHCVNPFGGRGYKPNEIVLMALNLNVTETAEIKMTGELKDLQADQYVFTPANGDLNDRMVKLNGYVLKMINDTTLPQLKPVRVNQPYRLPPLTYGYFVIVDSFAPACM